LYSYVEKLVHVQSSHAIKVDRKRKVKVKMNNDFLRSKTVRQDAVICG